MLVCLFKSNIALLRLHLVAGFSNTLTQVVEVQRLELDNSNNREERNCKQDVTTNSRLCQVRMILSSDLRFSTGRAQLGVER